MDMSKRQCRAPRYMATPMYFSHETKPDDRGVEERGERKRNAKIRQGAYKVDVGTMGLIQRIENAPMQDFANELEDCHGLTGNREEVLAQAETMKEVVGIARQEIKDGKVHDPDAGINFDELYAQTDTPELQRWVQEALLP
ncbi:unnamed protein product [Rhizoctonia solani]|uniref:Uncharacterized protein n=1 Tax=Rhizoctonia solani TaxID=456999 RepID=A0A8H3ARD3_9AGAM|nr:unnamed protein product [Rhizoctonia solani]